jgi:hypothetical protein
MPAEMLAKRLALLEPDDAHGGGRAVLLVVGVEDQEQVSALTYSGSTSYFSVG